MTTRKPFRRIGLTETKDLMTRSDLTIFDVRATDAFDSGHIGGAHHLTVINVSQFVAKTSKENPVLIYCYHGFASQEYAQIFGDFGFLDVYSLDGGFEAWRTAEQPPHKAILSKTLETWLGVQGFSSRSTVIANNMTPLMKACHLGEISIVKELVVSGETLNAKNSDGNNALWLACVGNSVDAMTLLIDAGFVIDILTDNGATTLMYAASSGRAWAVERLLAAGADTALETQDGFTALDMASTAECLQLLRKPVQNRAAVPVKETV